MAEPLLTNKQSPCWPAIWVEAVHHPLHWIHKDTISEEREGGRGREKERGREGGEGKGREEEEERKEEGKGGREEEGREGEEREGGGGKGGRERRSKRSSCVYIGQNCVYK